MRQALILMAFVLAGVVRAEGDSITSMTAKEANVRGMVSGERRTFKLDEEAHTYYLGLKKPEGLRAAEPSKRFLEADGRVPGKFHLKNFGAPLTGIYNQGSCGSCVYNSLGKNAADVLILRGKPSDVLARQHIMDCLQRDWMCNGSYGEKVAQGIVGSKGVAFERDYPYRATNQSCKGTPSNVQTGWDGFEIIDNSPKSIAGALLARHPVSVTVAADGQWSGYSSGVYNGCSSMGTNHEVLIYGYDCETSVDAEGRCVFDDKGYPKNGDGYAVVVNSWGKWGENGSGEMRSRWRGRSGQLCNNLAEEALILKVSGPAPVDGGWSAYSAWGECKNSVQTRTRTCTNPAPANGGADCQGPAGEQQPCLSPSGGSVLPWVVAGVASLIAVLMFILRKK